MDRQKIIALGLATLKELGFIEYKKPDPANGVIGTLKIWEMATADLTDAQIKAGFDGLIVNQTSDYNKRIVPGDLRKFVNSAQAINHGQMFDEIMQHGYKAMYGEFNRKTGQVEHYQFNPLISAAIRQMGGLSVFLNIPQEELGVFRAQFRDVVNAINEKNANKAITSQINHAKLGESKPVMMIEQKEPEANISQAQDPRVQESFAALRAKFEARRMADATAKEQAVKLAALNMIESLEALSDE